MIRKMEEGRIAPLPRKFVTRIKCFKLAGVDEYYKYDIVLHNF